jgi:UDP-2,3-diacylglucosamine pyrophosphatase LpxH
MSQDKGLTNEKLSALWSNSAIRELDHQGKKYVIISDVHLGDGKGADDLRKNEETLIKALEHYNNQGYQLILLGDIEEFWQFDLDQIKKRYNDSVYARIRDFGDYKVHRVFGNHDSDWQSHADPAKTNSKMPGCAVEALKMKDSQGKTCILLVHGHQGSKESDKNSWLSRPGVRIYKVIEPVAKFDPHTSATKSQVTKEYEQIMYSWAKESKVILICGHSHRAIFASKPYADFLEGKIFEAQAEMYTDLSNTDFVTDKIREVNKWRIKFQEEELRNRVIDPIEPDKEPLPCYFNTGCALFTDGITTIEIADDEIRLVKWHKDTTETPRFQVYQRGSLSSFIADIASEHD